MAAQTPASLVHYYDTEQHRIVCGLPGFDHRSTKHSRSVTCEACVGLMAKRPTTPWVGATADATT